MKDNAAIILSVLCLIHCIVTPLIIAAGIVGSIAYILDESFVHIATLILVVILALLSLPNAYHKHSSKRPMWLAGIGISAMFGALFIPEHLEMWVMVIAAFFVISGHGLNKHLLNRYNQLSAQ